MLGNASTLMLYWEIGGVLVERQKNEGWGAGVLPRLEADLKNELPEEKGFSERNMRRMIQFYREYPDLLSIRTQPVSELDQHSHSAIRTQPVAKLAERRSASFGQPPVAQMVPQPAAPLPDHAYQELLQVTWAHNLILMQKVKALPTRLWYARQAFEHGWGRDLLSLQIQSRAHERQGRAVTNFQRTLPPPQSDLAAQLLKDPYVFDFLTLEKPFHERELETGLLRHLQDFLVELGTGFAFVGRQVHLAVGDDDFYIDLLFYHLKLRCYIVIDLKLGRFKAEYAGKMNFYLNAVDDRMKHASDQRSIGLILCEDKDKIVAEYALRGMDKSIGVSAWQLTRALPKQLQSALPSIAQIEAELSGKPATQRPQPAAPAKGRKRKA
jgi:predicted nuclease of restriction endonuclease-like (RecB) superfamily